MKVAIVTHFPKDPAIPRGGVEAVSVNLVKALAAFQDLNVHVVTFDDSLQTLTASTWQGATIHRLPGTIGHTLTNAIGRGRRQISQYILNLAPDVVHAHDTYGLMVKGLSIPRIFTIHGFIYADTLLSSSKWAWIRSKIWEIIETSGWADQPHIISISPYVRERLAGIATGVIHDIDNPVSESFFHIARKERKGVIFSAAVISQRKNTLNLVKAFSKLLEDGYDVELRLAGPVVEPDYGRQLKEAISQRGLDNRVILLGQINAEQVHKELSIASVFALVSLEEGSPMGIEEAMAASVPVVTSNRCGMPYMIRHGESGYLVNPFDVSNIARRLKQLLQHNDLRDLMGKCAHTIALDRFHPEKVARRTREIYLEAVEKSAIEELINKTKGRY